MTSQIRKITRRKLRDVFPREDDFTVWLRDNIDVLSDQTGIILVNAEREQAAGSFRVDIVAETDDGRPVVIENQLGPSNHDHLGKLLTYLAAFDAKVAIWIADDPRPEHVQAVAWLNQTELVEFYFLKVEAVVIGDSDPAPLLTRIVGPSAEASAVGATKKEFAERHEVRYRFWEGFIKAATQAKSVYANRTPSHDNWLDKRDGRVAWIVVVLEHGAELQLYADGYQEAGNQAVIARLAVERDVIEADYGEPLAWDIVQGRKHAKVTVPVKTGGYRDEHMWPEIHMTVLEAMSRFQKALRPFLAEATRAGAEADNQAQQSES